MNLSLIILCFGDYMKKILGKKIVSILISISIIITSCSVAFYAKATNDVDVNVKLLESLLNDREWVIETLEKGILDNNPYNIVNTSATSETLLDEVLQNYKNDAAFKTLVDAMDVYANTGEYLSGITDSVLELFGGNSDAANKVVASTDELKYESILNEVLKTDYYSSWGDTLFEENMNLEKLRQQSKMLKKLRTYQTVLKDYIGMNYGDSNAIIVYDPNDTVTADYKLNIQDYVGHFLDAYQEDLEKYLNNVVSIPSVDNNESLKKKIVSVGALAAVSLYERTVIPETSYDLDDMYYDGMYDDTMAILKGAGKVLKIANKTTDCAILLEALQSQKNTTVKTMTRIEKNTSDKDLAKVFNNYSDLINSAGNKKTLAYETVTNYLRNENTVTNIISTGCKKGMNKIVEESAKKYVNAKTVVLANSIANAAEIVSITVWVADMATGIEQTAKKIYECKYLKKIINEAVKTYRNDLAIYNKNKTDANAEKVLADLDFLKMLRLYGEKCAYGSMSAQMESVIGQVLGGGQTKEYLDRRYQGMVDTFLGCTFAPVSNNEFNLSKGDVLNLRAESINGKKILCADLNKKNGNIISFAEADMRLLGGINLNGATINIFDNNLGVYLPIINNSVDGSQINVYSDNVVFGTINNSSNLSIEIKRADKNFKIAEAINNSGNLRLSNELSNSQINIYNLNNSGSINMLNCKLDCYGTAYNNGTINGMVNICFGNQLFTNSYYIVQSQIIGGNGQYTDLEISNSTKEGIKVNGTQTVTNSINNTKCRVQSGERITLTGNCSIYNNKLKNSVSLKDFSSTAPITFDGNVYLKGTVSLAGKCLFSDGLEVTSNLSTFTLQNEANVKGDMLYSGGVINGSGFLKLHGDLDVTASNPSIRNLELVGLLPQSIYSSSVLNVGNLICQNSYVGGVTFDSRVNVSDSLQIATFGKVKNGKNIVLVHDALIKGGAINCDISAENWTCNNSPEINGTLFATESLSIASNANLKLNTYNQASGELVVNKGASINCNNSFIQSGITTNYGTITSTDDCAVRNNLSGGTVIVNGDLDVDKTFAPDNLILKSKVGQRFNSTSSATVKNLQLNNASKDGISFNNPLTVTEELQVLDNNIINGKNIILMGKAVVDGEKLNGSISAKNWECSSPTNVKDTLYSSGNISISDLTSVQAGVYNQFSGTLTVGKDASLNISDSFAQSAATTNNGTINVVGDSVISAELNGGKFITKGDIEASASFKPNALTFDSKVGQRFYNSSSTTVDDLAINNSSKSGFDVGSVINVNKSFTNNCLNLKNGKNIVLSSSALYINKGNLRGDLAVSGEFTVNPEYGLTVYGNLILNSGATFTVPKDAKVVVKGSMISSSAKINVENGGYMQINDSLSSSSDVITVSGDMCVKGDAMISSSTVNAIGLMSFMGDLDVSSGTWNKPNVSFNGKVPQTVNGSAFSVNDLTVSNKSKTGIKFYSNINYYGKYSNSSLKTINENNIIKK